MRAICAALSLWFAFVVLAPTADVHYEYATTTAWSSQ